MKYCQFVLYKNVYWSNRNETTQWLYIKLIEMKPYASIYIKQKSSIYIEISTRKNVSKNLSFQYM